MVVDISAEMETVVMEYAGPLGKFVVRKQLKDLNRPVDSLNDVERRDLIKKIVGGAVYNNDFQKDCTQKLCALLIPKPCTAS